MEKATQAQDEKEKYIIEELKNIFKNINKDLENGVLNNDKFMWLDINSDIGLDSIDICELIFYIEEKFNISLVDENINFRNVNDVYETILGKIR
ncbi:MAG TPA: acyl carrier protein [bacterium]|nr:acyl carrier protein [bacterium]HPO11257.1 acyl carrier protein [bacterium]